VGSRCARAFCLDENRRCPPEEAEQLALHLERVLHGAPSGVDPAICARGGVILFERPDLLPITGSGSGSMPSTGSGSMPSTGSGSMPSQGVPPPRPTASGTEGSDIHARAARIASVRAPPFWLVVALTGLARGTRSTVLPLRERRAEAPHLYDPLLQRLGALTLLCRDALVQADVASVGACFDEAHALLQQLGVSCAELDDVVGKLKAAGAPGAKLTGAGGGGAAIAIARDEEQAQALARSVPEAFIERIVP
jgi:mevalonate kinase